MEVKMFLALPKYKHALDADIVLLFTNLLLMKLGGQIEVACTDFVSLARDYSGCLASYSSEKDSFTLTLKTRPEEFPEHPNVTQVA